MSKRGRQRASPERSAPERAAPMLPRKLSLCTSNNMWRTVTVRTTCHQHTRHTRNAHTYVHFLNPMQHQCVGKCVDSAGPSPTDTVAPWMSWFTTSFQFCPLHNTRRLSDSADQNLGEWKCCAMAACVFFMTVCDERGKGRRGRGGGGKEGNRNHTSRTHASGRPAGACASESRSGVT